MDKIIVMVRTSTSEQDIADQHNEMEDYVISKGWRREQIVWVEEQGASAAKVDDTYRSMIDTIKEKVEMDKDIKCFAVWHLNRLARTEEVWVEVKTFFVSHGVQVLVKNPELRLLTEDGKVDAGMELAAGLLAILSVQDQLERREKFKRAKKAMAQRGEYVGGHVVPYGYKVEGREYAVNEDEAKVIRLAFELYRSGNYSASSLAKELEERGHSITDRKISRMLAYRGYLGESVGELGTCFPPIVSKELFDACQEVREENKLNMRSGDRIILGAKIIRCPSCGAVCTSNSKHYVCCKAAHKLGCENTFHIRHEVADELLIRVASEVHLQWLIDMNSNKADEYRKELEVLDGKLAAGKVKLDEFDAKKERIIDAYIEGRINKKNYDLRLLKLQNDIRVHQSYLTSLQAKIEAITGMLEIGGPDSVEAFTSALDTMDGEESYKIIHRHIKSLIPKQVSYGVRDPRTRRPNAVEIEITTTLDIVYKFLYVPKKYQGCNLFLWNGRRWVEDRFIS